MHQVAVHRALVDHCRARPHLLEVGVEREPPVLPDLRLEQEVHRALCVERGRMAQHHRLY